jgi:hypothetical protein
LILSTLFSICTFSADTPTQQLLITFKVKSLKVSNIEEIHTCEIFRKRIAKKEKHRKNEGCALHGSMELTVSSH